MPEENPKITQHEYVQLDHVLKMYHVGYHKGHRPSSIHERLVKSEPSTQVPHGCSQPRAHTTHSSSFSVTVLFFFAGSRPSLK